MTRSDNDLESRLAELERRVDHLYARLQLAPLPSGDTGLSVQVLELIQQGKEIEAIKQYRLETGVGLAEAKQAIDAARG
jgi:ribosomal protein L7/L12